MKNFENIKWFVSQKFIFNLYDNFKNAIDIKKFFVNNYYNKSHLNCNKNFPLCVKNSYLFR